MPVAGESEVAARGAGKRSQPGHRAARGAAESPGEDLGSYVLGANLRRLSADWERSWGHPLLLAEAFVEMRRYKVLVYLAANWIPVG